jgi:hypothetical protein
LQTSSPSFSRFPNEFIAVDIKTNRNRIVKDLPPTAAQSVLDNGAFICYQDFAINCSGLREPPLFE